MGDTLKESAKCLICFHSSENNTGVSTEITEKILHNCVVYLHSAITLNTLQNISLKNENTLPFCQSCCDSALELVQLSEQLAKCQKEISDLAVTFSLAVFHRRSQIDNQDLKMNSNNSNQSATIELNVSCLPPHLFATKNESQDISCCKITSEDIIVFEKDDDCSDVIDMNEDVFEEDKMNDIQFDGLSENYLLTITGDTGEESNEAMVLCEEIDEGQDYKVNTVEEMINTYDDILSEQIINLTATNTTKDSINSAENGIILSELMKTVTLPEIKLERINIGSHLENENRSQKKEDLSQHINSKATMKIHQSIDKRILPRKLNCSFCSKRFTSIQSLKAHEKMHTSLKLYKCSFCNKVSKYSSNMQKHEKTHTEPITFKCSFCVKAFNTKTSLERHERSHTGNGFTCSFCDKMFYEIYYLRLHEKIHATGENPFKCSFCKKGFTTRPSMKAHERNHTGDLPFKCSFCETKFARCSSLLQHEKTHKKHSAVEKPFKCSICQKRFSTPLTLKVHKMRHKGEPSKCSICDMTFTNLVKRNRHQKTHCEEPPQLTPVISSTSNIFVQT